MIRWTKSDAIKLGKAIADFNRAIKDLETELNKLYLPESKEYQDIRKSILTRSDFRKVVNSMKRFSKYTTSGDLVTLPNGEIMTKWEKKELDYARAGLLRKVNAEMKKIETAEKPYRSDKQKELEITKQDIRDIYTLTGEAFERKKNQILKKSSSSYDLRKNIIYKENYIETIRRKYSNFDNYDKLINYMQKLSPKQFYDKSQSVPQLEDLTLISDQTMAQNEFNKFVESWIETSLEEDVQE